MIKTITKTKRWSSLNRALLLALVLSVFSWGKLIAQPLSGTYTIGTGGNYSTITAALADLNTNGVSGPVTMTFLTGNYTVASTISIGAYAGVDATNTLTFTSANRDSVVFSGSISGAIIALNQSRFVTIDNITVINNTSTNGSGIAIVGSTSTKGGTGCTVKRCKVSLPNSSTSYTSMGILNTSSATGYGTGGAVRTDSLTIDSNIVTGAYYGIYLYFPTAIGNTYAKEIKLRGNVLNDSKYYGMYLFYIQNGIDLGYNTVTINSAGYYGIYMANSYNHHTGNTPHRIYNNKVYNAAYSLYLPTTNSTSANPHQIYNNVICGRGGIYNYGIYLTQSTSYPACFNIYHNTVKQLNATYGYCLYYSGSNAGNVFSCMNNIFALGTTSTGYYPMYIATSPTNPAGGQAINNNVYYSVGSSSANILYRGGAYTSANYNTTTSGGDSSIILLPGFTSTYNDGHLIDACNRKGSPIGSFYVPSDIDGQTRSTTEPFVGADEPVSAADNIMARLMTSPTMPITVGSSNLSVYVKNVGSNNVTSFNVAYTNNAGTPVVQSWTGTLAPCTDTLITFTGTQQITLGASNAIKVYTYSPNGNTDADPTNDTISVLYKAPLAGTYTIGTGGNYPTFQAAAADLANGVGAPVTFKVLAGAYTGQVIVNGPIPGTSATNTVTFDGDTAASRTLTVSMAGQGAFVINGANYVQLRNLTISNTASGATVVGIVGNNTNNAGTGCAVSNCILNLANIQTTSYGISVTATAGGHGQSACRADSITIDSNIITNAYYGISIYGASNNSYNRNFKVRNNTLNNVFYMGAYLYYIYAGMDVLNNSFIYPTGSTMGYGLYIYYNVHPTTSTTNIIGNRMDGSSYAGIYLYNSSNTTGAINIFNNVVGRINYAYHYNAYFYVTGATQFNMLHNTFRNDLAQSSNTYGNLVGYLPTSNSIIKNNIFACTATSGTQTPVYLYQAPSAANSINYNVYYNAAGINAIYRSGVTYTSANFKTTTAGGDSSYFADPKFISATNLRVSTCFNGVDLTSMVSTDITGATRNIPPKAGAYENTTPFSYASSNTIQMTGQVAPGAVNYAVLRIPVVLQGCGTGYVTEARFSTTGTTNVADIAAAKLYSTGIGSTFNTNKLLGTVTGPSGQFVFSFSDTVSRDLGDTVNYWLAYDISGTATNANLVDARVDSINILGAYKVPSNNNPTGNLVIALPMTYVGSTSTHTSLSKVAQGSSNNVLLRITVNTSASGSPIEVSNFNLNTTGGGMDTLNINNAKIYYTGSSSTFSSSTLFGTYTPSGLTSATWPTYSITGNQLLGNGANYFWLTYDMKSAAVVGDSVDAEVTGITVFGTTQTPTVTAPAGNRKIRQEYCTSNATSTADEEIWNVTVGGINNTSTCTTTGGPGSIAQEYSNYTSIIGTLPSGIPMPFSIYTGSCGGNYTSYLKIFIDYNGDGDFLDAGEEVYSSGAFTGSTAGIYKTGSFTVPCTANAGETRMRVVYQESSAPVSCGTYTWGETEDYTVNIIAGPPVFSSTTAMQLSGSTSAGALDVPILRIPVKVQASPCNPATITELNFNTAGTSVVANISAAKLYKTNASSTFNTNNLVGTAYSPSGNFTFYVTDTANNDTNNYWLAYDVASTALSGATLDARFDSVQAFGSYYLPVVSAPAGNKVIANPMTYVSSTSEHTELQSVEPNSVNNRMLRIMVRMSSTGAPVALTQFSLNTNGGGNDTANISNAKIYYTGSSPVFASTSLFGSYSVVSPTSATWPSYNINGNQLLANDTNYFWLTYDLKSAAVLLDSVDAEVTGITIATVAQTPTVTAPTGRRIIRGAYCASAATSTFDGEILNVTVDNFSNTSTCSTTGGVGSILNGYSNYTDVLSAINIYKGAPAQFNVHAATCNGNYTGVLGIWIDYNQDGDFLDAGETVHMSSTFTYGVGMYRTGSFVAPATATNGVTRMRVVLMETSVTPISPCGTYGYGETEDYAVNILPAAGSAYVWNGSVSTNVSVAANWTPVRSNPSPYDKVTFNSSSPISLTGISGQVYLGGIEVTPSTVVNMTAATGSIISVLDSLTLGANARVNLGLANLQLGWDTLRIGVLTGTGRLQGSFERFFNTSSSLLSFPMTDANNNNRTATVEFTTFPAVSGSLTTSFVSSVPANTGLPLTDAVAGITATRAGINGFWTMGSTVAAGTFNGTFTAGGFTGVSNYSTLFLMRRADAVSAWTTNGTFATTTGSNALPVLSRTGMTLYGQFGVGGDTTVNPLPVNMLYFTAHNADGNVLLNWATASEENNKGYVIERSIDGNNFSDVEFVKGQGNSSRTHSYSSVDKRAFEISGANTLYYRLRQEDMDGSVNYSNVVMVNVDDITGDAIAVFPNPFVNTLGVKIEASQATSAVVELTDMQGRVVSVENVRVDAGTTYHNVKTMDSMSSGVYFVNVTMNGNKETIKVVKTH